MKPREDQEVAAWLHKADGDRRMAFVAASLEDPLWDQACFHAQQCAEKTLKALLSACEEPVPRSHDLVLLLARLRRHVSSLAHLTERAAVLTQHGVAPRYPSFLAPHTEDDARNALAFMDAICDAVLVAFSSDGPA